MSEIRQSENIVTIVGRLKEKDIKIEESKGKRYIKGEFVISTGGNNEHTIKVFSNELTKAGSVNPSFTSLQTAMHEFVSIAEALAKGGVREDADIIEIKNGSLKPNEFYAKGGAVLVTKTELNASFVSRVKDTNAKAEAKFKAEVFFESIKPEVVKGDETGRVLVKAYIVLYEGVVAPISFVAVGSAATHLSNNYETKKTSVVWGEVVNNVIVTEKVLEGFGESREETNTTYTSELIIAGGLMEMFADDDVRAYSKEVIKAGLLERDTRLEVMKAKSASGGGKPPVNKAVDKKAVDSNEIPF